jgi:RimJ/RimL family protein N-acetyltransferase
VIRRSGHDEAETHFALQRAACVVGMEHIFPPERHPYPDEQIRERWRNATGTVLVSERGGEPVGVVLVEGCWLHGFYVRPDHWGTGVANELHDAALAALSDCAEVKLWVLEENRRARRFYEKNGWRENGETRVVPYPPNPLDVGYTFRRESPSP